MSSRKYTKPSIKTLPVAEILESLGPVSCGSGFPLNGAGSVGAAGTYGSGSSGGYSHMN